MILIVNFLTNTILIFLSFSLSYALETGLDSSATGSNGNNIILYANGEELEAREIDNYPIASSNRISLTNTSDRIE